MLGTRLTGIEAKVFLRRGQEREVYVLGWTIPSGWP
jgi:hypothetical protein